MPLADSRLRTSARAPSPLGPPARSASEPDDAVCLHCGLPLPRRRRVSAGDPGARFCCFGCSLVHEITGSQGEEARARLQIARFMFAAFLAMGMMMFSTLLYADAWYPATDGHALGPLAPIFRWIAFGFAAPLLPLLGYPLGREVLRRNASAADGLILLGALAAFVLSAVNLLRGAGEVHVESGAMVLLLMTLGRSLEAMARARASGAARGLLELCPEEARRIAPTISPASPARESTAAPPAEMEEMVPVGEIRAGDRLRVLPGERFPVDGRILRGRSLVDASLITGESQGRERGPGDAVPAGAANLDGVLEIETTAGRGDRWIDRAAKLLEAARGRKGSLGRLADRAARAFLPLAAAAGLAAFLYWLPRSGAVPALLTGLSVLLVACPCALGLATPLATWVAIGRAARSGILVRGGDTLEALARGGTMVFDKTGTLTSPRLEVEEVRASPGESVERVLAMAGALARSSRHPASRALAREAERRGIPLPADALARAIPGLGLAGEVEGVPVRVGSERFIAGEAIDGGGGASRAGDSATPASEGALLVAWGEERRGAVTFRERIRPEARSVLEELRLLGFRAEVLTGDSPEKGRLIERELGIPVRAGLLPAEKMERVEALAAAGGTVAMVGDGINDAPALAAATVGIALGSGADLAKETADVVLLARLGEPPPGTTPGAPGERDEDADGPGLGELPRLVRLSRQAVRRIRRNLAWAFGYNTAGMLLAAAGYLGPASAALLMVLSSLFVVWSASGLQGAAR